MGSQLRFGGSLKASLTQLSVNSLPAPPPAMFRPCWGRSDRAKRGRESERAGGASVRPRLSGDGGAPACTMIDALPSDLLAHIWSYMSDARDLAACAAVCRDWRDALRAAGAITVTVPERRELR
jgi:hypothetical protein